MFVLDVSQYIEALYHVGGEPSIAMQSQNEGHRLLLIEIGRKDEGGGAGASDDVSNEAGLCNIPSEFML